MKVWVKFVCKDLTGGLANGEYSVPDGATVLDVIRAAEKSCGVTLPPDRDKAFQYILNDKAAQGYTPVPDGAKLYVLHARLGG
ncbi:MAG: hypothetical protein LBN99_06870 [Oscillospiraceae bacterium]|jgi:hypothetical protein|nr:hypothetical protein [Oscillospiraceae bacterium]